MARLGRRQPFPPHLASRWLTIYATVTTAIPGRAQGTGAANGNGATVAPRPVAYSYFADSNASGNYEILFQSGAGSRFLTNDPTYDSWWPRLSPDGQTIMFMRTLAGEHDNTLTHASLWTIRSDGTGLTQRVANPAALGAGIVSFVHPEWRSDGAEVLLLAGDGTNQIVYGLPTSTWASPITILTAPISVAKYSDPNYNPTDSTVVCVAQLVAGFGAANGHYFIGTAPDTASSSFTGIYDNGTTALFDPAVSPDGTKCVFTQLNASNDFSLRKVDWPTGLNVANVLSDTNINTRADWRDNASIWFHRWLNTNFVAGQQKVASINIDGTGFLDSGLLAEFPSNILLAAATGVGTANRASSQTTIGKASGTGVANGASIAETTNGGLASATGAAQNPAPSLTTGAGNAAGTGAANGQGPTVVASAGLASGTGAANNASQQSLAGTATGSGTANGASIAETTNGGNATATGAAQSPSAALSVAPAAASGSGAALSHGPTVAPGAGVAQGTGVAQNPTVQTSGSTTATAGLASGTGTAQGPSVQETEPAGIATASGSAQNPAASLTTTAGAAAGVGAAYNPTITTSSSATASAGLAAGIGAASGPAVQIAPTTTTAAGLGAARAPTIPGARTSFPDACTVTALGDLTATLVAVGDLAWQT